MNSKREIFLSFDIEEFDVPEEFGTPVPQEDKLRISAEGLTAILDLLDSKNVSATFFITAFFAEQQPELLKRIAENHEIASHGYYHSEFKTGHLAESRKRLMELTGQSVSGFRMPRLAAFDKKALLEAGYRYDASLNPTLIPGRYNNLTAPLTPFQETVPGSDYILTQFPTSVVPYLRFPLFWLAFKNLPLAAYCGCAAFTLKKMRYFSLYMHPWEFSPEAADSKWNLPRYIVRHAGKTQTERLAKLIDVLKKHGTFQTHNEWQNN